MHTTAYQEARKLATERHQRAVLRILRGTEGWISDRDIAETMRQNPDSFERTVRLIIHDLRRDGYPIASESGRGYRWAAKDPKQITATIADLRSRANNMLETANIMERGLYREIGGKKAAAQIDAGQQPMHL